MCPNRPEVHYSYVSSLAAEDLEDLAAADRAKHLLLILKYQGRFFYKDEYDYIRYCTRITVRGWLATKPLHIHYSKTRCRFCIK